MDGLSRKLRRWLVLCACSAASSLASSAPRDAGQVRRAKKAATRAVLAGERNAPSSRPSEAVWSLSWYWLSESGRCLRSCRGYFAPCFAWSVEVNKGGNCRTEDHA